MSLRIRCFFFFLFIIPCIYVTSPGFPVGASPPSFSISSNWTDEFSSTTLDSRWSWVREDATHWSLTTNPGFMRITTQPGGILSPYYPNNEKNILLTEAPQEDFIITAKVTMTPTQNYQSAGILCYQNDDNYVHLIHVWDTNSAWISFHREERGSVAPLSGVSANTSTLYLRICKIGNAFRALYSLDGSNWQHVQTHTISLTHLKVGIDATNMISGATQIPADFDYFKVELLAHHYMPTIAKQ